jgi:hypothetical protein
MPRQHHQAEKGEAGGGGRAVWDTGSSLYDSYELAAVRRILDRNLADEPPPVPAERGDDSKKQVVVFSAGARRGRKKVTLRTLFMAVVSWVITPRKAQAHTCTCVGIAYGGGAIEPLVTPHGKA